MPLGAVPAFQIVVAWVANSFIRPTVKRSAAIAICNTVGNAATIYGSYMYPSSDSPRFLPGGAATAVICLLVAALAWVLRIIHIRMNKQLETAEQENFGQQSMPKEEQRGMGFRYVF